MMPSGPDQPDGAISKAELRAIESLRSSWTSILADLRQMEASIAKCSSVLQAMDESSEKEQLMNVLKKSEDDVQNQLTRGLAVAGALNGTERFDSAPMGD
jgi:hypothetical protein